MDSTELTSFFATGDAVVYSSLGIGFIKDLETRNDKKYLRIKLKSSDMDVLLPEHEAVNLGLRHICSKDDVESAFNLLSEKEVKCAQDWKTRMEENKVLLKSGEIKSIAMVVNVLYRRSKIKELPTLERKLYESALSMLVDESSYVLGINSEETRREIFTKLEE
mgnify:CR=1 FL=1